MTIDDWGIGEAEPPGPDVPYNAADRRHVRAAEKAKKFRDKDKDAVLKVLLAEPNGRAWLRWLLFEVCRIDTTTANAAFDPQAMMFREGAREVGLTVYREALRLSPQGYVLLLQEQVVPE